MVFKLTSVKVCSATHIGKNVHLSNLFQKCMSVFGEIVVSRTELIKIAHDSVLWWICCFAKTAKILQKCVKLNKNADIGGLSQVQAEENRAHSPSP